jgi:GTP cyclohydrolase FolE2
MRCQFYGHTKSIAPDPMFALSVGVNTTCPCAQKTLLPQPHVLYAVEPIQQVTKEVLYTKIYSKHGVKLITQYTHPLFRLLIHP